MQKPIRYYITKSGEEPTVRSVTVALSSPPDDRADTDGNAPAALLTPSQAEPRRRGRVKRLVEEAMRKRSPDV